MNTQQCKFSDIEQNNKRLELHVGTCFTPPTHLNLYDQNRGDFFSIAIVVKGNVNMKINLREQSISQSNMVLLMPNTIKQLVSVSDDVHLYKVIFTSKFLMQIGIEKYEIDMLDFTSRSNEEVVTLTEKELNNFIKVIEDLKHKNDNLEIHPFGEQLVNYTFRIFLSEMAAIAVKYKVTPKNKTSRKQDLVSQFGNLVNKHFKEYRSVKYYADQLAITPKYLTEVVHEVTGESASVLIDEKVMHEAKVLLNNPRLSIAQIADALHFSDQSFLGKFFKRHLGLSPSQYRNHELIS